MKNSLLKKLIILLIIIVVIISIVIVSMYYINKNNNPMDDLPEGGSNPLDTYGKNQSGGIDYQSYFDVKSCMKKYINTINIDNSQYISYDEYGNEVLIIQENEVKQKIYNLLSDKYISENNITVENLYEHIKTVKESPIFVPVEISLIQDGEDIKSFLVYGLIESQYNYSLIDKIFAVVNINLSEFKFSIEPIYGDYNDISEIEIKQFEKSISDNEYNDFIVSIIENEDIPKEYADLCKQLALGAPEKLYKLLDEEYRNAKFASLDEFKAYIERNKSRLIRSRLSYYQVDTIDNNTRYLCIDQHKNYYIINQKEALQDYTVMLDRYTIDLSEFEEKYDGSQDNEKVALNIEKILEALKARDYKYVYEKLDYTFKFSNFKTQDDFEKYIKENYDSDDTITYEKYEKIAGVHTYDIKITKSGNKTVNAKIVMALKEERDFVFSFSIDN